MYVCINIHTLYMHALDMYDICNILLCVLVWSWKGERAVKGGEREGERKKGRKEEGK